MQLGAGAVPETAPWSPNEAEPSAGMDVDQLTGTAVTDEPEAVVVAPHELETVTLRS